LMTVLAQKHKEFSRLACACSNFLFFQGQRDRWVPHSGLLQMGGVCSSATYKSTEPPVVSTLSELLSKQLISVLGHRQALVGGDPFHPDSAVRPGGAPGHGRHAGRAGLGVGRW